MKQALAVTMLLSLCAAWQLQPTPSPRRLVVVREDASSEAVAEEEEAVAPKEKDEVSDLKATIADLEDRVRSKRNDLEKVRALVDDSGKNGYYRLAAQVETFKRTTKGSAAMSTERTKARVLKALMPVVEALEEMDDEGETKISSNYHQVYVSLMEAMASVGMEEFSPSTGQAFDPTRHLAANDATVGTVAAVLRPGYQVRSTGDLVRPAKCEVVASGDQAAEDEAED